MKSILITGATSFIGLNLIKELIDEYKIIAVVRKKSSKIAMLPEHENLSIIQLNMDEYDNLPLYVTENSLYAFIHLSWGGTRGAERSNADIQKLNYKYSVDALHSAEQLKTKIFMSAGSQAEYGQHYGVITENTVPNPMTEYGKSKLEFYKYAMQYCEKNHIRFLEPRFFSIYGVGDYSGTLVMSVLYKMRNNHDCNLTDCEQMWNFLNIVDAVKGMKILIENVNVKSGAYNFASNDTRKLKEFVYEMAEITNTKSNLNFGELPHNDSGKYGINPDIKKLLNTGWRPKIEFANGIKKVIDNMVGL